LCNLIFYNEQNYLQKECFLKDERLSKSAAYVKSSSCHDSCSERMQQSDVDMT